jgi:hypothetical protein
MNRPTTLSLAALSALAAAACGSSQPAGDRPAGGEPAAQPTTTAEQILDRYIEVTGGEAAYRAVKAVKVTGTFSIPKAGLTGKLEIYQAAPSNIYMHVEFPGMGIHETGVSGDVAWERSAMTGSRIVEGEERDRALLDATLNAEVDWRRHYRAELAGTEELEGRPAHKIVLTPIITGREGRGGRPRTRFYDQETGLLVRGEEVQASQMGEIQTTSLFSDYRPVGGGLKMPHRTELSAMGQQQVITIDQVELNPSLPPDRFAVPADIQKLQAP